MSNVHEMGIVTSSLDSTIKITDLSRCKVLHTVTAHRRGVHCFAHSKAFSLCASGGLERDILLWQGSTNRQVGEMTGHAASILHLAVDNRRCQVSNCYNHYHFSVIILFINYILGVCLQRSAMQLVCICSERNYSKGIACKTSLQKCTPCAVMSDS